MNTGNINFDDGLQTITLNGDENRKISWHPGDINFIDRFVNLTNYVEGEFKNKILGLEISDETKIEDYNQGALSELGKELCKKIDECFLTPVSQAAFMGVNPASPTSSGGFLYMNFLEALLPLVENTIDEFVSARKEYTDVAAQLREARGGE